MVQIESACFSLQKAGNRIDEYEDAFNCDIFANDDPGRFRFAIADGASESSFAGIWAGLLANAYCGGKFDGKHIHKSISKLSKVWSRTIHAKDLPWYAQEKLNSGAFSTLAGITFRLTGEDGFFAEFDAIAVGDSCIFHIRGDKIIASFPVGSTDDFHNRPVLISTNAANNMDLKAFVKRWTGTAQTGDSFLLMTDALACWMLTRYEEDTSVVKKIHGLAGEHDFTNLVHAERRSIWRNGSFYLRNDDVTLIRINFL
ncbi:protein phosphatase 2C domain-containing protein [Paenibacillus alkalitolerans]|uniref:protein phosphatase 2C domain-containing protein n=1 Tax=Paenibacillus alkalitolerans TaxID=2799335 RepID=UPI0018F2DBFC|nr:protein phosphatase 2C domain-containing protein [Paenibacillus alkalitolerans]